MKMAWIGILVMSCVETQRNLGSFCISGQPALATVTLDECRSSSVEELRSTCEVINDGAGRFRIESIYRFRLPFSNDQLLDCNTVTALCSLPPIPTESVFVSHGTATAVIPAGWDGEDPVCSPAMAMQAL